MDSTTPVPQRAPRSRIPPASGFPPTLTPRPPPPKQKPRGESSRNRALQLPDMMPTWQRRHQSLPLFVPDLRAESQVVHDARVESRAGSERSRRSTAASPCRSAAGSAAAANLPFALLHRTCCNERGESRRAALEEDEWAKLTARDVANFVDEERERRHRRRQKQLAQRHALDQQLQEINAKREREQECKQVDRQTAQDAAEAFRLESARHSAAVREGLLEQQRQRDWQIQDQRRRREAMQRAEDEEDARIAQRAQQEEDADKAAAKQKKDRARMCVAQNHEFNSQQRLLKAELERREAEMDRQAAAASLQQPSPSLELQRTEQRLRQWERLQRWAAVRKAPPPALRAHRPPDVAGDLLIRTAADEELEAQQRRGAQVRVRQFLARQMAERRAEQERQVADDVAAREEAQREAVRANAELMRQRAVRRQAEKDNYQALARQIADRRANNVSMSQPERAMNKGRLLAVRGHDR